MPRKKMELVGAASKNDVLRAITEKFNEEFGKDAAKIMSDDGDSFMFEFKKEEDIENFRKFIEKATKRNVVAESIVNAFGNTSLARIFFEKNTAYDAIEKLREYDEGAPPKGVDVCEGCGSKHAS